MEKCRGCRVPRDVPEEVASWSSLEDGGPQFPSLQNGDDIYTT